MHDPPSESFPKIMATGVLILASVIAYFAVPLLRFADPRALFDAGSMFAFGAAAFYIEVSYSDRRATLILFAGIFLIGVIEIASVQAEAFKVSRYVDQKCAVIQFDMLSPKPSRENLADAFQALGCRPQVL